MSKIQSRLNSLKPYLVQLRFPDGNPVVDMVFKDGWHVPQSETIQSNKGDSEELNYHMFYTDNDGFGIDDILDYIDNVIKLNIEREKKHELLIEKVKELQELFRKTPFSKLKGMEFILGGDKLVANMSPDPLDVVDFNIEVPTPLPTPQPTPQPVSTPVPQPVPQPIEENIPPVVNEQPEGNRAPNGELIPPLTPEDNGDIEEDFQKFDLGSNEPSVTKNVGGQKIDLPKKKQKKNRKHVELAEIEGPSNVICKCGPDKVCPACEEEKIGTY